MFLLILNTIYQIAFSAFALLFAAVVAVYAVKDIIDRIKGPKEEQEPVEIKGPALDVISEACEDICDNYCKYREAYAEDGFEYPPECHNCPLNKIL